MLRLSFPLGKIMGVDVRLHLSFLLLLAAAMAYGAACGNTTRGVGLWVALVFAVVVRETARSIAAAYVGLRLRALFLLPVGGVMAFAPQDGGAAPSTLSLVRRQTSVEHRAQWKRGRSAQRTFQPNFQTIANPFRGLTLLAKPEYPRQGHRVPNTGHPSANRLRLLTRPKNN